MRKFIAALSLVLITVLWSASYGQCGSGCCATPKVDKIIYMIGDGMGVAHVTAYMLENGYRPINLDRAQTVGLVKTHSANNRVTDSAAAGTALATGHKTNNSVLGQDPDGNPLESIMAKAGKRGMGTGIVVTSYLTDATPGAFYAHVGYRGEHEKIAAQLAESGIDVFMGGGAHSFNERKDGVDLTEKLAADGYHVVFDFNDLSGVIDGRAAGFLTREPMPYITDGRDENYLADATAKTLEILTNNDKDGKGFFIMVEGSQIDWAGHGNSYENIITETKDFDDAVGVAFDYADSHPGTLVVVLADHETGGLSLVPGDPDFTKAESGISGAFSTGGHTAIMIPMFAYGAGAEKFTGVFDNTDIPKIMESLLFGE